MNKKKVAYVILMADTICTYATPQEVHNSVYLFVSLFTCFRLLGDFSVWFRELAITRQFLGEIFSLYFA